MKNYKLMPSGDSGLVVSFGEEIDPNINWKIHCLYKQITLACILGISDVIPAYASLLICYDPLIIDYVKLCNRLHNIIENLEIGSPKMKETIHIPVLYGGEVGIDIDYVASYNHMTVEEVIKLHSTPSYLIYMLGFKPGFLYLGGLLEGLSTPRLESPRQHVVAGSIGIAGNQTGIYPQDSPGGWQMIGHTCIELLDWSLPELTTLSAGQYIKFYPVDQDHYECIKEEVRTGKYKMKISKEVEENNERSFT